MEGPSDNVDGLYCTMTKLGIYGTSGYQVMRNSLMALERGNNTVVRSEPIKASIIAPIITTDLSFDFSKGNVIDFSGNTQSKSKSYEWIMIQKDDEKPESETCKPVYFV